MSNSILFTVLDDHVIVRTSKGVYKQAKIAIRASHVFAKVGSGFLLLYANGTTSSPDVRWVDMENGHHYEAASLGRLTYRMTPREETSL